MFRDDRLLELIGYGFQGGPTFETTRVPIVGGYERRNAERSRPLYKYTALYDQIDSDFFAIVIATFVANLGPVHSFRFKDWADYEFQNDEIGVSDGSVDETMQLQRVYEFGDAGIPASYGKILRPITKPVDATRFTIANGYVSDAAPLTLTEDNGGGPTPLSFSCDYSTGIVTFTSTAGNVIRVSGGEFDVPVYFDDDELVFTFEEWRAHSTDIRLREDFAA